MYTVGWALVATFSFCVSAGFIHHYLKDRDLRKLMMGIAFAFSGLMFVLIPQSGQVGGINLEGFYHWSLPVLMSALILLLVSDLKKDQEFNRQFRLFILTAAIFMILSLLTYFSTTILEQLRLVLIQSLTVLILGLSIYLYIKKRNLSYLMFFLAMASFLVGGLSMIQSYRSTTGLLAFTFGQLFIVLQFPLSRYEKGGSGMGRYFAVQQELEKVRQDYMTLFENMSEPMIVVNTGDGGKGMKIVDSNDSAERMFGLAKRSNPGVYLSDIPMLDNCTSIKKEMILARNDREPRFIRGLKTQHENKAMWLDINMFPSKDGQEVVLLMNDVTEARLAQEAIRKSEAELRDLFDNALNMIQQIDENGRIVSVNRAWCTKMGYGRKEALGLTIEDFVRKDQLPKFTEIFEKVKKGEKTTVEIVFVKRNGREMMVEGNANARFEDDGSVVTRGIFHDMTDRKKAEAELRESEERFRSLFESSPDGIAVIDQEGRIQSCNNGLSQILGLPTEAIEGKELFELGKFDEEGLRAIMNNFERLFMGEETGSIEVDCTLSDGQTTWLEIIPAVVKKGGPVGSIQAIIRDITVRKSAELEKDEAFKELQREKDELELRLKPRYESNVTSQKQRSDGNGEDVTFETGMSYLIGDGDDDAVDRFIQAVHGGRQGLLITRKNPSHFRKRYRLEKTPMIWLTSNTVNGEVCIDPTKIPTLTNAIVNFIKQSERGIVLFSGLEYLTAQNGFKAMLNLLYLLNDKVMIGETILLVDVNPKAFTEQEINIIRSEIEPLGDGA